ncbi:MAG: rRNA maturation RNase YbeY [Sphingorhabdus sp.]
MIDVELDQTDDWDRDSDWLTLANNAVAAAFMVSSHGALADEAFTLSISIKLSNNDEVQTLNRDWREQDKPTNVLSFPMIGTDEFEALANTDDGEVLMGDMIIAHGVCVEEAREKAISLADHFSHLVVHGTLHLLGYDHIDEHEGDVMEELEVKALASLGLHNPYDDDI